MRNCALNYILNTINSMDNVGKLSVGDRLSSTYLTLWRYLTRKQQVSYHPLNSLHYEDEFGVVVVDDVVGWKVAVIEDLETLRFGGFSWGSYHVTGFSACLRSDHISPKFSCRCGFHAYKHREDAEQKLNRRSNAVLLRVGLYGTLVQHTTGWRAEQQDVLSVHFPFLCRHRGCASETSALRKDGNTWKAVCNSHAGDQGFTLSQLRHRHNVDAVTDI